MAIDVIIEQKQSIIARIGIIEPTHQLYALGALTIVVWSLESAFECLHKILWKQFAQKVQHKLRIDCYRHIQDLDIAFFNQTKIGPLVITINDDINQIDFFFDSVANEFIQLVTGSVVIGAIFFYLSPTIALITLTPLPFIWLITRYFRNNLKARYAKVRAQAGHLATHITNNILGIETIKSYVSEAYETNKIRNESNRYKQEAFAAAKISALFSPLVRMVIGISFIGTLVVGGYLTLKGKLAISVYSILAFQTQRFLWPFTQLSQIIDNYEWYMASIEHVFKLINTPMQKSTTTKNLVQPVRGLIEFKNVEFSYKAKKLILKNLSFTIQPGESVAFIGPTGCGKSTLIRLLLCFYRPTKGTILIDGQDITSVTKTSVRSAISFVSQEPFFFHSSIKDNIAYGRNKISLEQIKEAAKKAEADSFIMELPHKYSTMISENNKMLSGGQRQRISIARAILKDAPIFIFDEATSVVDNATEQAIQKSLENITHDHTTIIVAHKLSTVKNVDKIYLLNQGSIVESGSHEELLAKNGVYKKLWELQQ